MGSVERVKVRIAGKRSAQSVVPAAKRALGMAGVQALQIEVDLADALDISEHRVHQQRLLPGVAELGHAQHAHRRRGPAIVDIQKGKVVVGRQRLADPVALSFMAAAMEQRVVNALGLDALDDGLQAQHLRHGHAGLDQGGALRRTEHSQDEALIHLDRAEGQAIEAVQRRIAGAIVVHGQLHAVADERLETASSTIAARHRLGFGDLDLQLATADRASGDRVAHERQQTRRVQILCRDVQRHGGRVVLASGYAGSRPPDAETSAG